MNVSEAGLGGVLIIEPRVFEDARGFFLETWNEARYTEAGLPSQFVQDNLSYFAIDLDRMLRQRPEEIHTLLAEVLEYFQSGSYRPLALTQFPIDDVVGAFRYMAQRKNIGKVVVSLEGREYQTAEAAGQSDVCWYI